MREAIHKFEQGGRYILLDVNSGSVHFLDRMAYDMMDVFDGTNDEETVRALAGKYPEARNMREEPEEAAGGNGR